MDKTLTSKDIERLRNVQDEIDALMESVGDVRVDSLSSVSGHLSVASASIEYILERLD